MKKTHIKAAHTIPIPNPTLKSIMTIPVRGNDIINVVFNDEVSYVYQQTGAASPLAFSPQLPFGTFFTGDTIGPLTVTDQLTATVTISYIIASSGSKGSVVVNITPSS